MSRGNIRPGVCGICGVAVVQPETLQVDWANGHLYERKFQSNQTKYSELVLVRVRCMSHKETSDPRHYDSSGNVIHCQDIECGHGW